jgi:hypothetical protein
MITSKVLNKFKARVKFNKTGIQEEEFMGTVIAFGGGRKTRDREDLNFLLAEAVEISKKVIGEMRNGIFLSKVSFDDLLASKFNQVLLKEGIIDSEIFRCALYVARLFGEFMEKAPESYYGVDFFVRGWQENEPMFFRQGGDVCCLVCTFFEEFAKRRTSVEDFFRMGSYLYNLYYSQTGATMGWCMSANFKNIVRVAKEGIKTI